MLTLGLDRLEKKGTAAVVVVASRGQLLIAVNISWIRKEVQHLAFFKGIRLILVVPL